MAKLRLQLLFLSVFFTSIGIASETTCHTSQSNTDAAQTLPVESSEFGWFGDENLAVLIPIDGLWKGLGADHNFRNKLRWWEKGSSLVPDNNSLIKVTAVDLNTGTELKPTYARNIYLNETMSEWGGFMTALEFPFPGCWEITGRFNMHEIRFVTQVGN